VRKKGGDSFNLEEGEYLEKKGWSVFGADGKLQGSLSKGTRAIERGKHVWVTVHTTPARQRIKKRLREIHPLQQKKNYGLNFEVAQRVTKKK